MFSIDGYRALRAAAARVRRTDRGVLSIAGADRVDWLQGLVTQDVSGMTSGERRYSAYLTPQGRMIADLWIVAGPDCLLVDVPAPLAASLRDRLERLVFAEDVQVTDASARFEVWEICGTATARYLAAGERLPPEVAALDEVDLETWEVARVEDGTPRFLADMDETTIPLEAGIESRAISFTKGCYVGQEVIVRVTTRGGGRVARRLVPLRFETAGAADAGLASAGARPDLAGAPILSGEREVGRVTSAVVPPDGGGVAALGWVHRDFADAGTVVTAVWENGRATGIVR